MFIVDRAKCRSCGNCVKKCQQGAISFKNEKAYINNQICNQCGMCFEVCPNGAIMEVSQPEAVYKVAVEPAQKSINKGMSLEPKPSWLTNTLAGLFPIVLETFCLLIQNKISKTGAARNSFSCKRSYKGTGRQRRGRKKGRCM